MSSATIIAVNDNGRMDPAHPTEQNVPDLLKRDFTAAAPNESTSATSPTCRCPPAEVLIWRR